MKQSKLKILVEEYLVKNSNKIKINSKDVFKNDVFLALKGRNFHGIKFYKESISNGAKFIISDKKINKEIKKNVLYVKNCKIFLTRLAKIKKNKYKGKTIAITGSAGKTSLKENLKFYLSKNYKVSSSIKSYNNLLGVLISLVNLDIKSDFAIFELGTNNFREIGKLTKIVNPDQSIITNISSTHLENLKNTRNVAKEKSDIFNPKYSPNLELVILNNTNEDEFYLKKLAKNYKIKNILTFGKKKNSNYFLEKIEKKNNQLSLIKIKNNKNNNYYNFKVNTSIDHHIFNTMISLIIFEFNNLKIDNIINSKKIIPLVEGRGLIHKLFFNNKKITLIDESYNASPISMKNCLEYFENFKVLKKQKKILIIGEMNELGKKTDFFHKEIISNIIDSSIDMTIFCGDLYKKYLKEFVYNHNSIFISKNEKEISAKLKKIAHNNDIILAKGSNTTKVNKFIKNILKLKRKN